MTRTAIIVLTAVVLSAMGIISEARTASAPSLPRSPLARAAINRYHEDVRRAKLAYRNALLQADRREYNSLIAARSVAMKLGSANEVVRITEEMGAVGARFKVPMLRTARLVPEMTLTPDSGWVCAGEVARGDLIVLRARGRWEITHGLAPGLYGPTGGSGPHEGWYCLGATLDGGKTIMHVGKLMMWTASRSGNLWIGCAKKPWERGIGEMHVTISKCPVPHNFSTTKVFP